MRTGNVLASLVDEALLAWVPVEARSELTASIYAKDTQYLPGGSRFRSGLFSWEEKVLSGPLFPRAGRVLLGGAGAGRELVALVARGYHVVAFDPCLRFADAARGTVTTDKAEVFHASYEDLVVAMEGRGGRLAPVAGGPRFDAAIVGWGSFSHILPSSKRAEVLRAIRLVCPGGPVLLSFGYIGGVPEVVGKGRVRNVFRSAFAKLGAPVLSEDRDHFVRGIGFFSYLGRDEIEKVAADAGYAIALFEESPYPHAVLRPLDLK